MERAHSKIFLKPRPDTGAAGRKSEETSPADITLIDPGKEYVFKKESIESKSKNSPFINWKLKGKPVTVFVHGVITMRDELIL